MRFLLAALLALAASLSSCASSEPVELDPWVISLVAEDLEEIAAQVGSERLAIVAHELAGLAVLLEAGGGSIDQLSLTNRILAMVLQLSAATPTPPAPEDG